VGIGGEPAALAVQREKRVHGLAPGERAGLGVEQAARATTVRRARRGHAAQPRG
jgi:hypothetical protein